MNISHSKTRDAFPLSTAKIFKKTLASGLPLLVLATIGIVISVVVSFTDQQFANYAILAIVGIVVLLAAFITLIYLYQRWYFSVYFYDLTDDFIIIRKGPITPQEITMPYERVQDVYVDQDLLDRILGIYDVHLSSATLSSGMAAHIDGVKKEAADGLRSFLLKTVQQKIGRRDGGAQAAQTSKASATDNTQYGA